jgi:TPP-dependent pyruvate/acetoin dehydrogenase alpha subunit
LQAAQIAELTEQVHSVVAQAASEAEQAPNPGLAAALQYVYAEQGQHLSSGSLGGSPCLK